MIKLSCRNDLIDRFITAYYLTDNIIPRRQTRYYENMEVILQAIWQDITDGEKSRRGSLRDIIYVLQFSLIELRLFSLAMQ